MPLEHRPSTIQPRTATTRRRGAVFTFRQKKFCAEYLVDGVGWKAAQRAGYKGKRESLMQTAVDLLKVPHVVKAIEEAQARRAERVEVKSDDVLMELLRLLRSDIAGAFDSDGRMLPIHDMPLDVRRSIAGIEVEELFEGRGENRRPVGYVKKLRLWPKDRAVELGLRHLGLLQDKVQHDVGPSWVDAMKRVEEKMRAERQVVEKVISVVPALPPAAGGEGNR